MNFNFTFILAYICFLCITDLIAETLIDRKWNSRHYMNDPLSMTAYMKNIQMHPKTNNRLYANNMFSVNPSFLKSYNYQSKFPSVPSRGLSNLGRTYYRKAKPFGTPGQMGSGRPSRSVFHYMYRNPVNKFQVPNALYRGNMPYAYDTVEKTPNYFQQMYPVSKKPSMPVSVPAFSKNKPFTYPILPVLNNFTSIRSPHTKNPFGVVPSVKPQINHSFVPSFKPQINHSFVPSSKPPINQSFLPSVKPTINQSFLPSVKPPINNFIYPEMLRHYKSLKPTVNLLFGQKSPTSLSITPAAVSAQAQAPIKASNGNSKRYTQMETTLGSLVTNYSNPMVDAIAQPLHQIMQMAKDEVEKSKQNLITITSTTTKTKVYNENNPDSNWEHFKAPSTFDFVTNNYNTSSTEKHGLFLPTPIATEHEHHKGRNLENRVRQHSLFTVEDAIATPTNKNNLDSKPKWYGSIKAEDNNKYPFSWSGSAADSFSEFKYNPKSLSSVSQDSWYPVSTIVTVQPPKFSDHFRNEDYSVASSENYLKKTPSTPQNTIEPSYTHNVKNDFSRETQYSEFKRLPFYDFRTTTSTSTSTEPEPFTTSNSRKSPVARIVPTSTFNEFRTTESFGNSRINPITSTMPTVKVETSSEEFKDDGNFKSTTEIVNSVTSTTRSYRDDAKEKLVTKRTESTNSMNIPKKQLNTMAEIKNRFKLRRPKYRTKAQLDKQQNSLSKETENVGSTTTEISKELFEDDSNLVTQNVTVKPTKSIISKLKQKAATSSLQFLQDRKNLRLNMTNTSSNTARKRMKTINSSPKPESSYHTKPRIKSVSTLSNLISGRDEVATTATPTIKTKRKEREFVHSRSQTTTTSTESIDIAHSSPQPKRSTTDERSRNVNRGSKKSRIAVDRTKTRTTTTASPRTDSRNSSTRNSRTRSERINSRRTTKVSTTTTTTDALNEAQNKPQHSRELVEQNEIKVSPDVISNKITKNPETYESAIMKISNFQEHVWNKQREETKRYGRGSSNLETLTENLQTLDIPITISTEVPKLPIEAFFTEIQKDR